MSIILKYAITALLVVIISEVAKNSGKLGALLASLPLVTLLVLCWLYVEQQPVEKIVNHAFYTFWYVLGSLPFFLIFPLLLGRLTFTGALLISALVTLVFFWVYAQILAKFGIVLLW